MPDYGRDLSFGYFLVPNAADPLLDTAREVEARGLDLIGVQDHPYQRRYVDTWVLDEHDCRRYVAGAHLSRCR